MKKKERERKNVLDDYCTCMCLSVLLEPVRSAPREENYGKEETETIHNERGFHPESSTHRRTDAEV